MRRPVVLRGYRFSVYSHIARVALHEKGVSYETEEINPFAADISEDYLKRHPFRRVPVLSHGEFDIYETAAIRRPQQQRTGIRRRKTRIERSLDSATF